MSTIEASTGRYRIAEIGRLTGFAPTTLRYYENAGVLAPPDRTAAGYRVYDDRAVERLRLVARAKELGCTLEEIGGLVEAWDADDCGPVKHRLRSLVSTKVGEVERHIAEQQALAAQLRETAEILAARPVDGPCDDTCGCTISTATPIAEESSEPGCGCAPATAAEQLRSTEPSAPAPPLACSLSGGDMQTRVEEWQGLLAGVTRAAIPHGLRLRFPTPAPLADIARLVEAEQACCAFFTFTITLDHHGVGLDVTAPADAQPMLDSVFGAS